MKIPKYMTKFKCIGTPCEDNCCVGWDVDIDEKTFKKYVQIGDKQLKRDVNKYVSINPYSYDPNVDFAFISLNELRRCQFLNSENLCLFHKIVGEAYLSNVCATFPRIYNRVDKSLELSATASCPEVVKLLDDEDAMSFIQISDEAPRLMSYELSQGDKRYRGLLPSKLLFLRDLLVKTIMDRSYPLEDRIYMISIFVMKAFDMEKKNKLDQLEIVLEREVLGFKEMYEENESVIGNPFDLGVFVELTESIVELLLPSTSDRYNELVSIAEAAVNEREITPEAFTLEIAKEDTLLTNYYGNQIYRTLFPFTEGTHVEDALKLFLVRYAILKRHMIGLSADGKITKDNLSKYLQSFSKVFEHHKHFEVDVLELLKMNKINSKSLLKGVIGIIE